MELPTRFGIGLPGGNLAAHILVRFRLRPTCAMSGVISRFLITPRVFALFESGLSLRCRPLLLFQFPMKFKKFSICLFTDVEHLVALVLGDCCPARLGACLLG